MLAKVVEMEGSLSSSLIPVLKQVNQLSGFHFNILRCMPKSSMWSRLPFSFFRPKCVLRAPPTLFSLIWYPGT